MKKSWRLQFLALAMLPFIWELPYAFKAMAVSPAERWNWCFFLCALALLSFAGAIASRDASLKGAAEQSAWRFASLTPAGILLLFGAFRHIHLAFMLGGILLPYTLAACLYGRKTALLLLPGCGLLGLFCPSVGIILSTFFPMEGILLKTILAVLLTALLPVFIFCRLPHLKLEILAFAGLALLVAGAYLVNGQTGSRQPPLQPVFDNLISEHFRGVQDDISAADRQFFGNSRIKRFTFNDQRKNTIQLLVVSEIDNIHQVHPTTYCLRVNGFNILMEHALHLPQDGELRQIDVQELVVARNGEKHIFWQWYSNKDYSTASFLLFRALYSPAKNWTVYIIEAPIVQNTEETQLLLRTFINENLPK